MRLSFTFKNKLKKIIIFLSFLPVFIVYQNFSQNQNTSVNPIIFEYGPNPQAIDYHTQFNPNLKNFEKFVQLRKRTNRFHIHQVAYYDRHSDDKVPRHNARWSLDEAKRAAIIFNSLEFKVSTTTSGGLSRWAVCNVQESTLSDDANIFSEQQKSSARSAARLAATFEITAMRRLKAANIKISRIYLDGPFLMILKNSRKQQSCGSRGSGIGNIHLAAYVVDEYISRLAEEFPQAEFVHLINLVNWLQITETGERILPTWGVEDYNLSDVLDAALPMFKRSMQHGRYTFAGISLDSPWSVISKGNNLTKFLRRISLLKGNVESSLGSDIFNGPFFLSFIVNTEPRGHLNSEYFLRHFETPTNKNSAVLSVERVCNERISSRELVNTCLNATQTYYEDSFAYAQFLIDERNNSTSVLSDITSLEIQFGSWHDFPRTSMLGSSSYADFVISSLDSLQPNEVANKFVTKPRLSIIERAVSYQACSSYFRRKVDESYIHNSLRHLLCSRSVPSTETNCRRGEYLALRPDLYNTFKSNPMQHWISYGSAINLCEPNLP